ncbi:MAG: hypothetical protein JNJ57_21295 [Saprospiraceae bacterium]|nr:hypothetical protein [Saprospiraceae bacterium]
MLNDSIIKKISIFKIKFKELPKSGRVHILVYESNDGTSSWYCPVAFGKSILLFSREQCLRIIAENDLILIEDNVFDIDHALDLLQSKGIDKSAHILDIINLFDDFAKALKIDVSTVNMNLINNAANYLTFNRDVKGIDNFNEFLHNYVRFIKILTTKMI